MRFDQRLLKAFEPPGFETNPRFQLAVMLNLAGVLIVLLDVVNMILIGAEASRFLTVPVMLGLLIGALVYMKKTGKSEEVSSWVVPINSLTMTILIMVKEQSFLAASLQFYIIFILHTFLLCRRNRALLVSAFIWLEALVYLIAKYGNGLTLAKDLSFADYALQTQITNGIVCFFAFIIATSHVRYKTRADEELRKERDWMLKNSRLHEISGVTHNLTSQIERPLAFLRTEVNALKSLALSQEDEAKRVAEIARLVDEIIVVSQSFDWFYRSVQSGSRSEGSLLMLVRQLEVLLESKAQDLGWKVQVEGEIPNLTLSASIPSLILLLVTLGHSIFDQFKDSAEKTLHIALTQVGERELRWTLSWDKKDQQASKAAAPRGVLTAMGVVRASLIQDLRVDCGAEVFESETANKGTITVTGPFLL